MNSSNLYYYISTPLISAFIGWITTWLAIKMIFRPHKKIKILFLSFQGLIPMRKKELAKSIGEVVETELVSHKDVSEVLSDKSVLDVVSLQLESKIDSFLESSLKENPMIGLFLKGDLLENIKNSLTKEIRAGIPEALESFANVVEKKLNFQQIVQSKVESFDLEKLESIIYSIAAKELRGIEILCGILGFVIGVFQVLISVYS